MEPGGQRTLHLMLADASCANLQDTTHPVLVPNTKVVHRWLWARGQDASLKAPSNACANHSDRPPARHADLLVVTESSGVLVRTGQVGDVEAHANWRSRSKSLWRTMTGQRSRMCGPPQVRRSLTERNVDLPMSATL